MILLASAAAAGVVAIQGEAPAQPPAAGAIAFGPTPPSDIANPADPQQAAVFAWQEFIAMTWPAKPNPNASPMPCQPAPAPCMSAYLRGQPDPNATSGSTGPGGTTVWETFYHRAELYPGYAQSTGNVLPDPNAAPAYLYPSFVKITPAAGADLRLFNNADEASEINIAFMYYTPQAKKVEALRAAGAPQAQIDAAAARAPIVYEAKGNPVIFNYLKSTGFNNSGPRGAARTNEIAKITNSTSYDPTKPVFELPAGSIEIKATWRRYDSSVDDLSKFHWAKLIYYTGAGKGAPVTASNDIFLLVGLHIIQKTPNVPTFTFATFEHVSNEANGFRFTNVAPQSCVKGQSTCPVNVPRPLPDPGIINAARQFPIPAAIASLNSAVQNQLRTQYGQSNVWANYQLIGIQAVVQNDPGGAVPSQTFFLSNFATETNDTLQFFQGGLAGPGTNVPNPDTAHVAKAFPGPKAGKSTYRFFTAGGCVGCHGSQGQFQGGDFSVIAATGNFFVPEPLTPYPVGTAVAQNPQGFPLPHQAAATQLRQRPSKKGR